MEKIIIIKYGELTTKKNNINYFLTCLLKNIKEIVKDLQPKIEYDRGRMFIFCSSTNLEIIATRLQKVFGLHEIIIGYKLDNTAFNYIEEKLLTLLSDKKFKTFKVLTKRSDKNYPLLSLEISRKMGGLILERFPATKVDIHQPELLINVEIREKHAYLYFETIKGLGGYPVGVQGKGLLMLSGGIDSPVAGYLAIKRGIKIEAVYFESPPHTSSLAKQKVLTLAKYLAEYNGGIKVHIINFTAIQEAIYQNIPHDYLITIMRRMMYRISAIINHNINGHALINGESIGQVASQTLTSMQVINEVVKTPVIRPVACFDKLEIIALAEKIGTYETSILPYEDCCTIFVPEHPTINPKLAKCLEYEELIPFKEMIYQAIKEKEVVTVTRVVEPIKSELL